ncbi:hypothetical protein BaRGS_00026626 [Batillaria attramentaria]|uniref:FAS1 domain-containing protein n=1 Tax=Batillaria attramentaria TaxID=370345 RepID=A0ABD0K5S8_9CAEN
MAAVSVCVVFVLVGLFAITCDSQSIGVANNIYDSLTPLGCSQFLAILNKAGEDTRRLYAQPVEWTVFVPNDTAFNNLPPNRRNQILSMTPEENDRYVKAFTIPKVLQTTQFSEQRPEVSRNPLNTKIFFTRRSRREGNSASGVAGPTEYYANGAMVLRPNIPAGRAMIHIIDRVLDIPSNYGLLGYISDSSQPDTAFYSEILKFINYENYDETVEYLNSGIRLTAFVPTKEALGLIPKEKMDVLRNNPERLNDVVRMHIIPNQVLYTSFVYHNEGVNSLGRGSVTFRTSTERETVYVSSGGVTAQITHGNITVMNGALHFVDALLGFKYNSALDEIEINPLARAFREILIRSRNEIQQAIVAPAGVTVFVPTSQAFQNIPNSGSLMSNQSLINMIMEMCMLEQGQEFELTRVNGDYEARMALTSRYFRRKINVYSQGNETWVESGYVKARVVRPDVGVTNGFVHFINAVPGVPNRDVPNTIFCEDWLIKSSIQLDATGLNRYLRDPSIQTVAPCTTNDGVGLPLSNANTGRNYNPSSGQTTSSYLGCGLDNRRCSFTVFIPNGTAIDNFENRPYGRQIQEDANRWSHVLQRHITRQVIHIDVTAYGQERTYTAVNGDEVRYRRVNYNYAYLYYKGKQAKIIHTDLGATNGVVHIIDEVIFVEDDLTRDVSLATRCLAHSIIFKQEAAHDDSIWSCAWGRNDRDPLGAEVIVTGSVDDTVKVWKWHEERLELRHTLEGHQLGVVSVDINAAGTLAASSSLDSHVKLWDLENGKQAKSIDAGPVDAWTIAFSPDSRFLASGSHTGKINLFGVDTGRKETSLDTRGKFTLSIAYSPDGKYIASGALDGIVNVFDITTGKLIHTLEGHAMPIRSLCFSPDSQLLVTASDDCHIKIYDVQHANLAGTLSGHGSWVLSVDFCPDNTHFVSASSDKSVKIWDAGSRQCVHTFYEHMDQAWSAKYSPSGTKIVSASDDRAIHIYDCPL